MEFLRNLIFPQHHFLFLFTNCMAITLNINSSPVLEISTKSHHLLLFFFSLLFMFLALVSSSGEHPSRPSSVMASTFLNLVPGLLPDSSVEKNSRKTVDFHPSKSGKSHAYHKSKGKEFEVGDHEVPSGPNPISNR